MAKLLRPKARYHDYTRGSTWRPSTLPAIILDLFKRVFALILAMPDDAILSSPIQIWIIDDDIQFCKDLVALWGERAPRSQAEFHVYPTAAEALIALQRLRYYAPPHAILIDGYLARDFGDLRYGANVVRRIFKGAGTSFPVLLGFSADTYANDDMVAAGATKAFQKIEYEKLIRYLLGRFLPDDFAPEHHAPRGH